MLPEGPANPYFDVTSVRTLEKFLIPEPSYVIKIFKDQKSPSDSTIYWHKELREMIIHIANKDETSEEGIHNIHALAHELGHALASICHFPHTSTYLQMAINGQRWSIDDATIYEGEKEAWCLAEKMLLTGFAYARERSLASYRKPK